MFLFKGVKDSPAVGGEDAVDLYSFHHRPDKKKLKELKEQALKQTITKMMKKNFVKTIKRQPTGGEEEESPLGDSPLLRDSLEEDSDIGSEEAASLEKEKE
jgi:hypothetical protein